MIEKMTSCTRTRVSMTRHRINRLQSRQGRQAHEGAEKTSARATSCVAHGVQRIEHQGEMHSAPFVRVGLPLAQILQ